jgi:hypothetical protein
MGLAADVAVKSRAASAMSMSIGAGSIGLAGRVP